jgi:hypothetical protein
MDHTAARGTCFSCHNGITAQGKIPDHIPSNNNCDACHTTNSFSQARTDHANLEVKARSCRSCHAGVGASGKPLSHVPTTADCGECHTTLAWSPARFNHTGLSGNCQSCHNGASATGKVADHMTTSADCSTCHRYPNWTPLVFAHLSAEYPGAHRSAPDCKACHTTNTDHATWQFAAYRPTCAGCHASLFRPEAHGKTSDGLKYNVTELHSCTGACHIYTDAKMTTIAKARPAGHHKVTDGAFR